MYGANDRYVLRIGLDSTPSGNNLQFYQMSVKSFFNTSNITNGTYDGSDQAVTLLTGTEVIRNKVVKLLYFKQIGNINVSFYPANATGGFDLGLTLIKVEAGSGFIYSPSSGASPLSPIMDKVFNNETNLTDTVYNIS